MKSLATGFPPALHRRMLGNMNFILHILQTTAGKHRISHPAGRCDCTELSRVSPSCVVLQEDGQSRDKLDSTWLEAAAQKRRT